MIFKAIRWQVGSCTSPAQLYEWWHQFPNMCQELRELICQKLDELQGNYAGSS